MNKSDLDRCIDIAVREFHMHRADTFRHWSFIFQRDHLLEWARSIPGDPTGFTMYGYKNGRNSTHAESLAARRARGLLDRRREWFCVNVRLGSMKDPRMSRPCNICSNLLRAKGCAGVHYTVNGGVFKYLNLREKNEEYVYKGLRPSLRMSGV